MVVGLSGENGVLMAATIGVPLYACGGGTVPLLQAWLADGMSMGSAASWASANGVINGREDNCFDPAGPLTRAQTAAILYRYLNRDQTAAPSENGDSPKVYMTTDISPEGLMAVYKALNWTPKGKVAVKLSTGEQPASNYLRPGIDP